MNDWPAHDFLLVLGTAVALFTFLVKLVAYRRKRDGQGALRVLAMIFAGYVATANISMLSGVVQHSDASVTVLMPVMICLLVLEIAHTIVQW